MRLQFTLLQLSALCLAEQQQPLGDKIKGWFDKAASYIPTSVPSVPNPIHAASAKVAETAVTPLTRDNWKQVIRRGPPTTFGEPDEWLIYIFGGNNTCYGKCDNATLAWNTSVALLSATSRSPKLASIDCEQDNFLCTLWGAHPPSMYHVLLPQSGADPTLRYVALNTSSVTATEIMELHTKRGFESIEPYTGVWNPFTGLFAKYNVNVPLAYVMVLFAKMPGWLPMVLISLLSRTFMNRQMPQNRGQAPGAAPAPAAAPKPAAKK